ncbi:UDP-N-acetylglucosamine 1-carboxyvinyltransferase [Thermus thermamylovorans]|uniref:UDP-N-acetylglucosamine 1-carboxyvinyltransferase n=1 Tax=Thermus thermamylovorans TaxID=2509362 RepID=A0A4Q9AY38_9DEIN|nr:UDP-N-acetylglucosamine 1-carboxyvinyltransferase [Thermus thermamylovorans]TBH14825.1 UDP-N-acetylglucosamine 1-carboxyvinyltransferase [Thermus thermamylovorans]
MMLTESGKGSRILRIEGGLPLSGELRVYPAKNAALPILAASLLTEEPITLLEVPRLRDVEVMLELLAHLGTHYAWEGRTLHLHTPEIQSTHAPYELVGQMRASFIVWGALLARVGEGRISLPGGCAFGARPVDQHVKALKALGAEVVEEEGTFYARKTRPLAGRVVFDLPTVGGTEQAMLAVALGGEATLVQAAMEPEVEDLGRFLGMLGVEVRGLGSPILHVRGARRLGGGTYRIIPDRIEAGTYLLAAAATRGALTLTQVRPDHLDALLDKLRQAGHRVEVGPDWVRFTAAKHPEPFHVEAREYPGFPTDLQPIVGAYLATVPGQSAITDRVYPDRFTHVGELARMGAELYLRDRTLVVNGRRLHGAQVKALDIRAGGGLVVAALAAEGVSEIEGVYFLERGYEHLEERLRSLGARVGVAEVPLALAAD